MKVTNKLKFVDRKQYAQKLRFTIFLQNILHDYQIT